MSQHKFTEEQIAAQKQELRDKGIQVADFVRVSAEDFRKALAFLCEKWNFNSVVVTNGYFDGAKSFYPDVLAYGAEESNTFTLPCINNNESLTRGTGSPPIYSTEVRAGYLAGETNKKRTEAPIVGPVIAFSQTTACQALEFAYQLAAELNITIDAYSKGPKWNPENGISLEHEWAQARDIQWKTFAKVTGTLAACYDQTSHRAELEAAKAGNTDCNSLEFWVPQELYNEMQAARPER